MVVVVDVVVVVVVVHVGELVGYGEIPAWAAMMSLCRAWWGASRLDIWLIGSVGRSVG